MMKSFKALIFLVAIWSTNASAVLNVEITQGSDDAMPIAIIPFSWISAEPAPDINWSQIVSSDLLRSGRFNPVPEQELLNRPVTSDNIDYKTWRVGGIDHIVIGSAKSAGTDKYVVQFQLFDVFKQEQLIGYSINTNSRSLRHTAHHISDLIYQQLTGQRGAFNTRIAYVTVSNEADKSTYKLDVADTDGFNAQTVLTSNQPIMSPSWSPDGTRLAYVSFENKQSQIFIQHMTSGERYKAAQFDGINGAPVWSPDGTKLAMTLSKDGNPDIYILRLKDKHLTRVTTHWAIDTEPAWMPDSEGLIFTSNRSGKPQLYRLKKVTDKAQRLTFEGTYNASADVSSDGLKIAFVYREESAFKIATMDLETGAIDILTEGPLDESPSFAPNNSIILYAEGQKAGLAAVSADGRFKTRLSDGKEEVREPTWSPFKK